MNPFGNVTLPTTITNKYGTVQNGAFGVFLNIIFKTLIVGAGIYALFNLLLAGYAFMAAGDDPKKVAGAWSKIYQTMLGLAFTAGAFVLAAIFGWIIFGNPGALIYPTIPTP